MRILVLPDIHDRLDRVERILTEAQTHNIQAILCVGDVSSKLRPRMPVTPDMYETVSKVKNGLIQRVANLLPAPFYYIPGNHDAPNLGIRVDSNSGNWITDGYNTDGQISNLGDGVTVYGIGGSPAFMGWPYEWNEADQEAHLKHHYPWNDPPHIILTHTPPAYCSLGFTKHKSDAGSATIADLARQHKGLLLCGHIHEAWGVETIGECVGINVGALGTSHSACRLAYVDYDPKSRMVSKAFFKDLENGEEVVWMP